MALTTCTGSGSQAPIGVDFDLCPVCHNNYAVRKDGTIRSHVDRYDRLIARVDRHHEETTTFLAQNRATTEGTS